MPIFRGNVGNLLQHWVFCEILEACRGGADQVDFVDAYSMAPLADQRPKLDATAHLFDCVRDRLPGEQTPYEQAWHKLAPHTDQYPNSAAFLTLVWPGRYSLLLCESEPTTVQELQAWAREVGRAPNCIGVEVAAGDWRNRFRQALFASGGLALFSFDPYMFDRNGSGRNPGNMDPGDLDLIAATVNSIQSGVVVQLSTYSANNDNPQSAVTDVVTSSLARSGFQRLAEVRADGNMMSLVFGRNIQIAASSRALPEGFASWLNRVKAKCPRATRGAV